MNVNDTFRSLNVGLPEDILRRKLYGDLRGAIRLIDLRLEQEGLPKGLRDCMTAQREMMLRTPPDYPYTREQALARVRSQLRRYATLGSCPEPNSGTVTIGGIVLDDRTKTVTVEGETVALTPTEYAILHLLMTNPGKVFSTKLLYESVWQEAALGSEGAVAVHIRHLREKIEINPSEPRYLKVVWGQGYKLEGKG